MHLGKTYPYHPHYWCTTGFFWPGYLPWKMLAGFEGFTSDIWYDVTAASPVASEAGVTVPDNSQISWRWNIVGRATSDELVMSIETLEFNGTRYNVWKAELLLMSVVKATAWYYQIFPQYTAQLPAVVWSATPITIGLTPGPMLLFTPASYALGGTPYPLG